MVSQMSADPQKIARANYRWFLCSTDCGPGEFKLTAKAESTPYALCFALFGLQLLKDGETLRATKKIASQKLRENVREVRARFDEPSTIKPYRQLLTFTLSALSILGTLEYDPLVDLISEQIPNDLTIELERHDALNGKAGSGNQAMFLAIFLLHARDHLGFDIQDKIDSWVELHLQHMNRFGFWGPDNGMTHLQFQNGYHQHEILEYLGVDNPRQEQTCEAVKMLADTDGHFAPYPGGGGCYDYDAIFMLTPHGKIPDDDTRTLLLKTKKTILSEQQSDGGFCESLCVRPRSPSNLMKFAERVLTCKTNMPLLRERLRYAVTLQRPKNDRIHTHWTEYSRHWYEPDLWDSWFRMLAVARIDVALDSTHADNWGFIDYPGIGYHPSLASKRHPG